MPRMRRDPSAPRPASRGFTGAASTPQASHSIAAVIGAARALVEQECAAAAPKGAPVLRRWGDVSRHVRAGWIALLLLCASCGAEKPETAWPQGLLLSASRPALAGLLASLGQLEGTPLARAAQAWQSALPDCPELEAVAQDGDAHALLASLRCADPLGPLAAFHRERGERDMLVALPGEPGARATVRAKLDGAAARIEIRWPALEGRLSDVLPGDEPAGPDRLAVASRVAHGRARAAGPLDLAAWVPRESQGDRLFHLRDRMLSAALLDGTLEIALYQPLPGAAMPRSAAALGVRQLDAARAAAERFVGEIAATWRMRRTPFTSDAGDGACLPDLHVMPELAPC